MARNPYFDAVLATMQDVHDKKNEDYADGHNPYSNFENTASLTGLTVPQVFHVMISIKVERLRQLASGKTPNFESKKDTILDMANYCALWLSWEAKENDPLVEGRRDTEQPTKSELDQAIDLIETMDPKGEALAAIWGEQVDTYEQDCVHRDLHNDPYTVTIQEPPPSTLTGLPHDPPALPQEYKDLVADTVERYNHHLDARSYEPGDEIGGTPV